MGHTKQYRVITYLVAIAIPLAVGISSALLTRDSMQIYGTLRTPPLSPPAVLFPIVWTTLYVLMGVSSARVWLRRHRDPKAADNGLSAYILSLAFNFVWSILFFNLRQFFFAFIWLLVLLYLILRTVLAYRKVAPTAALLQLPYLLWVTFAGYLNLGIFILNR